MFKEVDDLDLVLLAVGIIYNLLPMKEINEKIFPVEETDEDATFEDSKAEFDTVIF